ncbi:UMPS-like protein [Mya arenaria]|uniref:UMPS-like protein n=1 Tax=Mya arenaria TaxID=6604 RepID=A0ABY7DXE9_MYAAR|nr:UMPS-like protein [Mya arenaria]
MADKISEDVLDKLIVDLFEIEGVKFGDFKLKSGIHSPAYFDLRVIVSYPKLMKQVSELLYIAAADLNFDSVCGVPYTALPLATVISVEHDKPMLIRRREAKDYGTKKMIEGKYRPGDMCLVVEDVVTSGSSVFETVQLLREYELRVRDAVVLLDREQGGTERLKKDGIKLHSVLTMSRLVDVLQREGKIDNGMRTKVLKFVEHNKFDTSGSQGDGLAQRKQLASSMTFKQRGEAAQNLVARRLFNIMENKQSNLAVSVDLTKSADIIKMVDQVGPHVCVVKTHVDIIEDFTADFVSKLQKLAEKHNFLIFEDRKYADIGNTVCHQYGGGIYKVADWAHITNAHTVPGPGVVQEMSSSGNLATGEYTKETLKIARDHSDFVIGFICQSRICEDPEFICMTPGVKLEGGGDSLGQQYTTPRDAVFSRRTDLVIVGRGITGVTNPEAVANEYRLAAFASYQERISQ